MSIGQLVIETRHFANYWEIEPKWAKSLKLCANIEIEPNTQYVKQLKNGQRQAESPKVSSMPTVEPEA